MIALDSRDYVTITYGGGVTAFTDYRIAQIEDKIVPMLSDGSYYKASDTYIEMCADTLDFYADKGAPLDSGNDPAKGWIKWVFVFVIPLAVASIVCGIFYAQMKTANEQTHANAYMPAEGLALSVVEDTYTHTTETETYDPVKDDSSSSSSGSKNRYAFQTIYITNAAKGCDSVSRSLAAYLFGLLWLTVISGSPSA